MKTVRSPEAEHLAQLLKLRAAQAAYKRKIDARWAVVGGRPAAKKAKPKPRPR